MAERVHRTLKEKIRCMLYAARLGTEFWYTALRHATWLYNRTYHSALETTPYESYTATKPLMDKLITYGARITVKQPGDRRTTLDHNSYDGIFLGYTDTMDNVVYWDTFTANEKTARHEREDELHYGFTANERSPAASHLLNVFTKGRQDQLSSNKPMGGIVFMMAGAAIYWRIKLQPTVALSSTEAEFTNMTDAGKAAIYLRSILDEIGLEQYLPTNILADNHGAIRMAMAHQPTRRTRHVAMKYFAVLQWTEEEHISFQPTPTQLNYSDSLSKPTPRSTFYEQFDWMMGRRRPTYTTKTEAGRPIIKALSLSAYNNKEHSLEQIEWQLIDAVATTQWHYKTDTYNTTRASGVAVDNTTLVALT